MRMSWTGHVQKESLCCTKSHTLRNDLSSLPAFSLGRPRSLHQCILVWYCEMPPLSWWNSLCSMGCARTVRWHTTRHITVKKSCLSQFLKDTLCLTILLLKLLGSVSLNWTSGMWSINTALQHSSKTVRTLHHQHFTSAVALLRNTLGPKPGLWMPLLMLLSPQSIMKSVKNTTSHWSCSRCWI